MLANAIYRKFQILAVQEEFDPGLSGLFVNPFYFTRRELRKDIWSFRHEITGRVLDVGCGGKPYKSLFPANTYIGLEIDTPYTRTISCVDFFYDGKTFPFGDQEFDSVVTFEVLEHVPDADGFLAEIKRVLKPDGNLLLTIPFIWDEHEQPHDYRRLSVFGLEQILRRSGFEVVSMKKCGSGFFAIVQLLNAYIQKSLSRHKSRLLNFWLTNTMTSFFNILGVLLERFTPKDEDLYLNVVVLARKSPA